ncbi:hypothetical protein HDE_00174 [Halotydeus destructor]|nr:hypothetical protein HDE_00174 [Halotydeus destructor]
MARVRTSMNASSAANHCDPETEVCENEIGTYRCLNINYREDPPKQDGGCDSGYRKMGDQCDDINECKS